MHESQRSMAQTDFLSIVDLFLDCRERSRVVGTTVKTGEGGLLVGMTARRRG